MNRTYKIKLIWLENKEKDCSINKRFSTKRNYGFCLKLNTLVNKRETYTRLAFAVDIGC